MEATASMPGSSTRMRRDLRILTIFPSTPLKGPSLTFTVWPSRSLSLTSVRKTRSSSRVEATAMKFSMSLSGMVRGALVVRSQ